jgi:HSP20 family protein
MNLSKWFPFKFQRKNKQERQGQSIQMTDGSPVQPVHALALMRELMHEPFFSDPFGALRGIDRWFGDHSPALFQPRVDVVDDGSALRISAELPGLGKGDVNVTIDESALTLRGEKRVESSKTEDGCYRVERAYGTFVRVIPLPSDVDQDKAEADFDTGVLTIVVPKKQSAAPAGRTIAVR